MHRANNPWKKNYPRSLKTKKRVAAMAAVTALTHQMKRSYTPEE